MRYSLWLLVACSLGAVSMAKADDTIYMLGKLNIQGTTYTQLVFFSDKDITSVEACEKEVMYGRTGQWQHYGHLVNKAAGLNISMNYICRASAETLSTWQPRERYGLIYEVDIRDNGLKLAEHNTYADCISHFKQQKIEESYEHFCAKSNQRIVK